MRYYLYLRERPFMLAGLLLGTLLAAVFVVRSSTVREIVREIGGKPPRAVGDAPNPCNNLSTRACAAKLIAALPESERRKLAHLDRRQLRNLVRRELRNAAARRRVQRQRGTPPPPASSLPQHTPSSPLPGGAVGHPHGQTGSGGAGGGGGASGGLPGRPTVNPNPVAVPGVGPVPPMTVVPPSIGVPGVPCIVIPYVTHC